jgi:hypothetical protein
MFRYIRVMRCTPAPFISVSYEELPRTPQTSVNAEGYCCDLCGKEQSGEPSGSGLLIWWRGSEVRFDEPPLCEVCARRIVIGAFSKWSLEDEDEG